MVTGLSKGVKLGRRDGLEFDMAVKDDITITFQLFHKDPVTSYCFWSWSLVLNIISNLKQCLRGDVAQLTVWNWGNWGQEEPHQFSRVTLWLWGWAEAQMRLLTPCFLFSDWTMLSSKVYEELLSWLNSMEMNGWTHLTMPIKFHFLYIPD